MDATIFVHSYHLAIIIHCLCLLGFYIAILFSVTTGTYGTEKKYPASITKHCTEYFHHWSWYVLCPSSTPDCYWSLCVQFSVLCPLFCWPLTLLSLFFCLLYPCSTGGGYTVLPLSFRPSKEIFLHIFLSNYWWQKSDIWSQASYRYPISWEAFLDPSDSYFLFADLVGFYTHLTSTTRWHIYKLRVHPTTRWHIYKLRLHPTTRWHIWSFRKLRMIRFWHRLWLCY